MRADASLLSKLAEGNDMIKQTIIAAIMLTGLTSCGGPSLSKNQRAEVENIAEDFADAASSDASANVNASNVDARLDRLEAGEKRALNADRVELDSLDSQSRDIQEIQKKYNELLNHYNDHLKRYHGGG